MTSIKNFFACRIVDEAACEFLNRAVLSKCAPRLNTFPGLPLTFFAEFLADLLDALLKSLKDLPN